MVSVMFYGGCDVLWWGVCFMVGVMFYGGCDGWV